jgi:pSer/pThr/pTyr-binding forkhead associated (FHA) protein
VAPRPAPRSNPSSLPWLDIAGDRYPLLGSLTTLGRDDTADIVVDDPGVSRRHSEIRVTTDGPHLITSIRDLNSTNGTFVNGDRISSQRLQDGDRVTLGRTSATFRAGRR